MVRIQTSIKNVNCLHIFERKRLTFPRNEFPIFHIFSLHPTAFLFHIFRYTHHHRVTITTIH